MSNIAFVLGNGESRKGIQIEDLKKHGTVFACNGVYRTDTPDFLIDDSSMLLGVKVFCQLTMDYLNAN